MKKLFFLPILYSMAIACEPGEVTEVPVQTNLKNVFEESFHIGTALNIRHLNGEDARGVELTKAQFNSITPENVMKWENIHPEPDEFNFDAADQFVEFGEENDMFMVAHTLVWHSQTPEWVFRDEEGDFLKREALLERMRDHIHTIVGRYKGRIQAWDVVNEALNDDGTYRESHWYRIIGQDYLIKAFEYAREMDPHAGLYYNDYSLENSSKREGAVKLVKYLQDNGAPITGIGTQGHFHLDSPERHEIEKTITDFADLEIDVMVTELDIDVLPMAMDYMGADVSMNVELQDELNPYTDGLPDTLKQRLADRYHELFDIFMDHKEELTRVTFWGVSNGDSWKNNWPVQGRRNYPLLFNREWQPNESFESLIRLTDE
ncbi:MAG: endo-1,4-beta-xylanase [Balneolales bacterium]